MIEQVLTYFASSFTLLVKEEEDNKEDEEEDEIRMRLTLEKPKTLKTNICLIRRKGRASSGYRLCGKLSFCPATVDGDGVPEESLRRCA